MDKIVNTEKCLHFKNTKKSLDENFYQFQLARRTKLIQSSHLSYKQLTCQENIYLVRQLDLDHTNTNIFNYRLSFQQHNA